MRAIDFRVWFIGITIVIFMGTSYQNVRWLRADYDSAARFYAREMLHIQDVSARTPSPRIIFAGGSSVIYAIDAKAIERDLGISVINMAMSNRIASDANYFGYLLPHIRKGDVVIYNNNSWLLKLTPEAEANDTRAARRLADRLWEFARIDLAERDHVDWPLLLPIPDASVFNRLTARERFSVRQRDDHGGLVQCPTRAVSFRPLYTPLAEPDSKVIEHSAEFVRDAESRGAHVIFFETPILIAIRERKKWSRYRKELRARLAHVAPVLEATESRILSADSSHFCDSASHVNDDIRAEWSQSLSAQLRLIPTIQALNQTRTKVAPLQLEDADKFRHLQPD